MEDSREEFGSRTENYLILHNVKSEELALLTPNKLHKQGICEVQVEHDADPNRSLCPNHAPCPILLRGVR